MNFDTPEVQEEFHDKCSLDEQLFWQNVCSDLYKKGLSLCIVSVKRIGGDGVQRLKLQRSEILARIY